MSSALLLVPDFSLILIGWLLVRYSPFDRAFWGGVERLVYFVLFPALLLQSTNTAALDFSSTSAMLGLALLVLATGLAGGGASHRVVRPDPVRVGSGQRRAGRFF